MSTYFPRSAVGAVALFAALAVACGATAAIPPGPDPEAPLQEFQPPGTPPALPAAGTLPVGPSALSDFSDPQLPAPLVDPGLILSGGPPPDGIPAIDQPQFVGVFDNLELLDPAEPVVALVVDDDARAYPVRIMIWHEIVNDVVGGVPVSVTYCPLCNSASTYVRRINGVDTTFGTSGLLYLSALVMYDRATESLWTHFDGRSVAGVLAGLELEALPSPLLSWADFRAAYPNGLVLDERNTGHRRSYGSNPYVGYDDPDSFPSFYRGPEDTRAVAKQRIVGITHGPETKAYSLEVIAGGDARATNDAVGGDPVVILWKTGQASALDTADIEDGYDVGSVGVFLRDVDGRALTFDAAGDVFVDADTGSTWSVTGEAIAGPLRGRTLERLPHLDTFWFAWAAYRPETTLVTRPPR